MADDTWQDGPAGALAAMLDGDPSELAGGEDDGAVPGETMLWRAVVVRMLMDVGVAFSEHNRSGRRAKVGSQDWREGVRARRLAVSWFTDEAERADFFEVCGLASYDPDTIRRIAEKVIDERRERYAEEDAMFDENRVSENPSANNDVTEIGNPADPLRSAVPV